MKVPTKFITDLSPAQISQLIEQHQSHRSFRVRNRSHAVLLSFNGAAIDEIANICRVDRDTVSSWLDLWNEGKFVGLQDLARAGRPKTLTAAEELQATGMALENPRFPARQIGDIKAATGKTISQRMLKTLLKKDYWWKRIKLGLWKRANENEKIVARQELEELNERAGRREIDLIYFDQSGFNLWAKVVYAWQKRGERIVVPVTRSKLQNVLGFMWHGCQRFESFVFEGGINAGVVIDCFDRMAAALTRETVVVIDNAPMHTSEEFDDKIEEWAELGLTVYRLPSYCPDLNKIEMLWHKIKYDWLSWEAYKSETSLRQELDEVLSQIGSKYQITFA